MTLRLDLLALDEEKLAALTNWGLVKRAARDLATGVAPELVIDDDGTLIATQEGIVTRLTPSTPLVDTACSCGALGKCRHRVMAVLAYRALHAGAPRQAPSPSTLPCFDDAALEAALGRRVLERASRARERGFVADVLRGEVPTVELSTCTVRFLVPNDLSYARCDCALGRGCEHVALAVWAAREAEARDADAARVDAARVDAARVTVALGRTSEAGEAGSEAIESALELVRELVLDGAEGSGAALAARFARAKKPIEEAKLLWPLTIVEDLEEVLASYAARMASYRPELAGTLATELLARARAGRGGGELPARAVLGTDEPARTLLEHVRLVSLGVRLHRESALRVRADVHLADPDTLTVLVLRRAWDLDEAEVGAALAARAVIPRVTLGALARGQLVSRSVERSANRSIAVRTSRLAPPQVTPVRGGWESLGEPLAHARYAPLLERMRTLPPAFVRPRLLAERVHVLELHAVEDLAYHAGEQTLSAVLSDPEGTSVEVSLEHRAVAPRALDTLALALSGHFGPPRYVSGELRREGARAVLTPLAVALTDRVLALDLEEPDAAHPPLSSRGASHGVDPHALALGEARDHLDGGAHHGLLHASDAWRDRLLAIAQALSDVGLRASAERVRDVHARMAARLSGEPEPKRALASAWLEASLHLRLTLEAL